jgi:hypothetical protein
MQQLTVALSLYKVLHTQYLSEAATDKLLYLAPLSPVCACDYNGAAIMHAGFIQ